MARSALIVGGDSLIGSAALAHLREIGYDVAATSRRGTPGTIGLDLAHAPSTWPSIERTDVAVVCAGVTSILKCAREPQASAAVNVAGIAALVERLSRQGTFALFLSSNQVFDGSVRRCPRDSAYAPVSSYGRQKAEAERAVMSRKGCAVLRLSKVFGSRPDLLMRWRHELGAGQPIAPFANFSLAPITVEFAIETIARIAAARQPGVFQASARDDIPYTDLAFALVDKLAADPTLVEPVAARPDTIGFERLPRYSSLDMGFEREMFRLVQPAAAAAVEAAVTSVLAETAEPAASGQAA